MGYERRDIIEFSSHNVDFTPHDVRWVPNSARFVVVGATAKSTGRLSVFKLDEGGMDLLRSSDHASSFKCCTFGGHTIPQREMFTGNANGDLESWDLESLVEPTVSVKAHDSMINAMDGCGGGTNGIGAPEIVTGSRDGTVKVWDRRQRAAVAIFRSCLEKSYECWSVAFGNSFDNSERCILAGYENGDIKMYDLKTGTVRSEVNVSNGVCSVEFDRKDTSMNKFVATCLESQFVIFDGRTYNASDGFASLTCYTKQKTTVWAIRHLPQDRDVMAILLGDGTVELHEYEYPARRSQITADGQTKGIIGKLHHVNSKHLSSQPINAWDWHTEKKGLAVCTGFDQYVRVVLV